MAKNFFNKPFDDGTLTKLELYENYLRKWIPVFISKPQLITNTINIFDFFSGAGCDSLGKKGSPMIAIDVLMEFPEYIKRKDLIINLYLNDKNKKTVEALKDNIEKMSYDKVNINVEIYNEDFLVLYKQLKPKMVNAANLIFLDQFGVKLIDKVLFQELINKSLTDILFYISAAIFKRFYNDKNIISVIELTPEEIEKIENSKIHTLVTKAYKKFIPKNKTYYLAPFSIKKGTNVYGLIFGSGHPLGIEKFLKICWEKDKWTGSANFDIEDTQIKESQLVLFNGNDGRQLTKIELFQENLKNKISTGALSSDKDIVNFMLNEGFLKSHVDSVIQELKKAKKISYEGRLSFSSGLLYKKEKEPTTIKLLK